MKTGDLIERLTGELTPVRRIAGPAVRLTRWLLVSIPATCVVVWYFGPRPDLTTQLADGSFLAEEAAALLTALFGVYAAFCAGHPDQPVWKMWLPLAPMMLWIGELGQQCREVLLRTGPGGLALTMDAMCVPAIALGGLVPAAAIVAMLRRGGHFRATHACFCGALGAAALSAAALRLYHAEDAAIMVIVWQLGSVVLFSLAAGAIGRMLVGVQHSGISRVTSG